MRFSSAQLHQRVVIGHHARRRRALDQQADVAPRRLVDLGEIIVLDVEAADQDPASSVSASASASFWWLRSR